MYLIHDETKTLRLLLFQGYRATTRGQFTFYHSVARSSRYSTDQPQKDEGLSWPCSHSVVLKPRPLDRKSSTLTTSSLLQKLRTIKKMRAFKKLNVWLSWILTASCCGSYINIVHVNVLLTYSYQVVKPKSF